MKYKWLNREVNNKIILFFNGWGMDENVVKHLNCEDFDVLMFYDYNTLDTDFDWTLLSTYIEKNLIAWSMGVMIGSICLNNARNIKQAVAINGTLKPIDAEYGINPKIYDMTINGFNEKGRERFVNSMFDKKTEFFCNRGLNNQQSELIALKEYNACDGFKYNKILISKNDKIIPTKSQVNYWGIGPNIEGGHCPFFNFNKWSDLL